MMKKAMFLMLVWGVLLSVGPAWGEDIYYHISLQELKITRGEWPKIPQEEALLWGPISSMIGPSRFVQPYVVSLGGEEMYPVYEGSYTFYGWLPSRRYSENMAVTGIAVRAPKDQTPAGRIFVPTSDFAQMAYVDFTIAAPPVDQEKARIDFLKAKERHYQFLVDLGWPGGAWFRHQVRQTRQALGEKADQEALINRSSYLIPFDRRTQLEQSYDLFTGGRALSENLQLERQLQVLSPTDQTIPVETIEGITVTEIDWQERVKGLDLEKDFLARLIPADQHVLLFSSFGAMFDLIDEAKANGTPVLRLLESRSEDAQTLERYQEQLCLPESELTRLLGPKLVLSVAFTGSDPYLRTGSDVAVLFEAVNVMALKTIITARQIAGGSEIGGAEKVSGTVEEVPYSGMVSPDRRICSYLASIDNVVVVTNSLYQLERLVMAGKGEAPTLASLDEYTFFRDRYKLSDPKETALLILTDAAIRRWCGPRWRIGASRRTRVAAVLAELQAQYLDDLARGEFKAGPLSLENPPAGMGELQLTPEGVISSTYGTLEFLTPIAELNLDMVTPEERNAYDFFRSRYQRSWREFFDPIALRFVIQPDRMGIDLSVMPLIVGSEYREFMQVAGSPNITAEAGDPHEDSILHYVIALNRDSEPMRQVGTFAITIVPGLQGNVLDWVGKWITFYADEDPIWGELEEAIAAGGMEAARDFLEKQVGRVPAALHVDVANPLKLTVFMVALRSFVEVAAPGMTLWELKAHNNLSYAKVSLSPVGKEELPEEFQDLAIYYAMTPQALIFTLNESILKRAIDRIQVRREALAQGKEISLTDQKWLGKNMGLLVKKSAFAFIQSAFEENINTLLQQRSWSNIAILNEWKRRYAEDSPVQFHRRFWQAELVCPGGGEYVWNEEYQTMESTVFGHPGQPRRDQAIHNALFDILEANLGLTFENDGLRARVELTKGSLRQGLR